MALSPTSSPIAADIDAVDSRWSGLRQGRTYLIYGPSDWERQAFVLRFLQAGAAQGASCLYVSTRPPNTLYAQAAALGFDLQAAHAAGLIKLLRFGPPPLPPHSDDDLERALDDLSTLIQEHQPTHAVVDDFSPFVAFNTEERLHAALARMLDRLAHPSPTLLLTLPTPETDADRYRLDALHPHVTEVVEVASSGDGGAPALTPHPGQNTLADEQPGRATTRHTLTADSTEPPSPRDAFARRLQKHFHQHAVHATPFLLIAIRGEGGAAQQLDFDRLARCTRPLLHDPRDGLVNAVTRRLIVLLPGGREPDATRFFARLKQRLRHAAPDDAYAYLNAFSALVVPNGEGFATAEEFLVAALDEA